MSDVFAELGGDGGSDFTDWFAFAQHLPGVCPQCGRTEFERCDEVFCFMTDETQVAEEGETD